MQVECVRGTTIVRHGELDRRVPRETVYVPLREEVLRVLRAAQDAQEHGDGRGFEHGAVDGEVGTDPGRAVTWALDLG